ncbi:MAG: septum formation initiator family protein [bacterium]|nr:septum formation initiator family protein [bacterium]
MTPRRWKRLFARIVLWAGIVAAFVLLFSLVETTWSVYTKERQARQAHLDEAQTLSELEGRQQSLTTRISELGTSRGIEEQVRDRYDVAKSGEQVIILTNTPNDKGSAGRNSSLSFWGRFLSWFSW